MVTKVSQRNYVGSKSESEWVNAKAESQGVVEKETSVDAIPKRQMEVKQVRYDGALVSNQEDEAKSLLIAMPTRTGKKNDVHNNSFSTNETNTKQSPKGGILKSNVERTGSNTIRNWKSRGIKTILWYDTHGQSMVGHSQKIKLSECEYKNCQVKYIITRQNAKLKRPKKPFSADAVLVQSRAIFSLFPPPRRDKNQVFVLAVRDAFPRMKIAHQSHVARQWINLFNYTMTYRFDSDFVYPYSTIVKKDNDQVLTKNYEQIFHEKKREALWFVSHCQTTSHREDYVKELRKDLEVDIYGHCGKKAPCPKGDNSCFDALSRKYKYYLAFENTLYEDYVTEKVFNWFNQDILIVVRGGSNYSRILPPGTFVNTADFKSARDLGHFLESLASNKSEYIAYLKRKDQYFKTPKLESAKEANCQLCEYLNTLDVHRKSYDDIQKWWLKNWRN